MRLNPGREIPEGQGHVLRIINEKNRMILKQEVDGRRRFVWLQAFFTLNAEELDAQANRFTPLRGTVWNVTRVTHPCRVGFSLCKQAHF